MSAVIHYQTLDERGDQILDELERRTKSSSDRLEGGERIYFLIHESPDDLIKVLDQIDPNWPAHAGCLTD